MYKLQSAVRLPPLFGLDFQDWNLLYPSPERPDGSYFDAFQMDSLGSRCHRVPKDASTIQAAINMANDGDLVLVAPGVYTENLQLSDKTITLTSYYHTAGDLDYIFSTIIDGNNGTTIHVAASVGPDTFITGSTIQNGDDRVLAEGAFNFANNRVVSNMDGLDYGSRGNQRSEQPNPHLHSNGGVHRHSGS